MSHDSSILGFIRFSRHPDGEGGLERNRTALSQLPLSAEGDDWPFLTQSMFSVSESPVYRDYLIHFAASYKDILAGWNQWEEKFHRLLTHMAWNDVEIFIGDEYLGNFQYSLYKEPGGAVDENPATWLKNSRKLLISDGPEISLNELSAPD